MAWFILTTHECTSRHYLLEGRSKQQAHAYFEANRNLAKKLGDGTIEEHRVSTDGPFTSLEHIRQHARWDGLQLPKEVK
jgi:hypothetical protein